MNYWLMKSEPDTFSIADLQRVKVEPWSGVRSTFARFHMRKMEVGDCWATPLTFAQKQSGEVTAVSVTPNQTTSPAVGTTFTVTLTANAKLVTFLPLPGGGTLTRQVTAQIEDDKATSC